METTNLGEQALILSGNLFTQCLRNCRLHLKCGEIRKELVQRRVDQTDRHRLAVKSAEHLVEVALLQHLESIEGFLLID